MTSVSGHSFMCVSPRTRPQCRSSGLPQYSKKQAISICSHAYFSVLELSYGSMFYNTIGTIHSPVSFTGRELNLAKPIWYSKSFCAPSPWINSARQSKYPPATSRRNVHMSCYPRFSASVATYALPRLSQHRKHTNPCCSMCR